MSDPDNALVNDVEFMHRLDAGWAGLWDFLGTLTPEQMTSPADAAGWTVKDHLMHLAVWEDGMNAVLAGEPRIDRMRVAESTWDAGDFDAINAEIRVNSLGLRIEEVLAELRRVHEEFRGRAAELSTDDLLRPYSSYQASSTSEDAVVWRLAGNTFGHYEEHIPWMQAIVDNG
jgi:hypothetical protein